VSAKGTRSRWIPAAALAVVAGAGLQLLPASAAAAPAGRQPATSAEATAMAQQVAQQLTAVDEQIHQAEIAVAGEQKSASAAATQAAAAQAAVEVYAPQLRAIAQGYTSSSHSRMAAFLTSSSASDLVQQLTTLDVIADRTGAVIAQVAAAQQVAAKAKATADAAEARAAASLATLQQQKKQLQDTAASYQATFNRLTAAQQAVVTNAVAGPTVQFSMSSLPPAPNATVAAIIQAALKQLGKPYVYGASGPDGFDCSGLTMYAFAAAGIAIPHTAAGQATLGTTVARADLRPGDLVFFYSPISHVGIYIGNGMMVHARTFGKPLAVTSVDQGGYALAKRLVP
jgi:cell wall-associated NlpC family hydrolase